MTKELIIFATLILAAWGCLITNCPRGGKRGGTTASSSSVVKECSPCGPSHLGQCFGPHICCGPNIGCFIGTPETYECRKQNLFTRPCIAGFAMCRGNTARCAANGICCSQVSCQMDMSCKFPDTGSNDLKLDYDSHFALTENDASNEVIQ